MTPDKVVLFIEKEQLDESARAYLGDAVEIQPYNEIFNYLKQLAQSLDLVGDNKDEGVCVNPI